MNKFYVTTPIYYVNDKPHIGHAYTTIACDILARFHKMLGDEVYFLTGTDEHGQKVEKAAIEASLDTNKFVDKMSKNFEKLVDFLGCNIDDFIRTTESRHKNAAQNLWLELKNNNQIYLSNYEGWYSVRDEAFYTESELSKIDNEYFAPSGAPVEWVKEQSYFFKLSNWQEKLLKFYRNNPESIKPKSRYNEVLSFIESGLRDLSISRTTFKWGVPVPDDDKHVMYVWIDALCNYLTSIGYPKINDEKFIKFWPAVHVVGKDILRFHAVYWPAFLMAAGLEPPKKIFAHGWWTNEGKKISKSLGNVIDPYEIINKYGLDQIRFFLFREVPFGNDGDFSKNSIAKRVNADLANNYGNLVQRIASFVVKNCNSIVKNNDNFNNEDMLLLNKVNNQHLEYINFMKNQQIDKGLKTIFEIMSETNAYIDNQAPWKLIKTDVQRMNVVLFTALNIIRDCSLMLFPVIPESANKVLNILNINNKDRNLKKINQVISEDVTITNPSPIFPRIE